MAKYKNREVTIIEELPNPQGDMVRIAHNEPGLPTEEIVPISQVIVSKDEKKFIDEVRTKRVNENEFKIEGETDKDPIFLPSVNEVKFQRAAEEGLKRAEEEKKKAEEWRKEHPELNDADYRAFEAIKVVPTLEEQKNEKPSKKDSK